MQIDQSAGAAVRREAREKLGDFLVAEYGHVTESLLRNEESGEKRAAFFLTLAGAAGTVLAFAFNGKSGESILRRELFAPAVFGTSAVLLLLGVMTVRRLLERHIVTDKYVYALRELRRLFVSREESAALPNAFFQPYAPMKLRAFKVFGIGRGGWMESVAVVNAVLAGIVCAALIRCFATSGKWWTIGLIAVAPMWRWQVRTGNERVVMELEKFRRADCRQRHDLADEA